MKHIHIVLLLLIFPLIGKAQVKDISFTLSPAAEYTWWDNKAGLEDGLLVGGKLGFGFGEYLELRAIYLQSLDLKTNFENFGLVNYDPSLFTAQDLTLTRWGGEFKANIGTGKLKPYLTLGTGVQSIELDDDSDKLEQIYASLGLGIKFNLTPRVVFSLEGKNTTYNFNAGSSLLGDSNQALFGVNDADFSRERLSNWSVQGSLQFYLGGRRPGTLTALDQAYLNKFKGGFKGLQLVVEPSANNITFDDNSLFRDTWMLGGYAGVDFNEYVGVRAFYLQATENEELSTDFDKLSMYGLEFRARLNDGNGVTPYLILGGGYLNPTNDYLGKNDLNVEGSEFASGGLGLIIPLGKNILITGGVRALVTSGEDVTDINAPDDLQSHFMYNAGFKFTLGKKSKSTSVVYRESLDKELAVQQEINNDKIEALKLEYKNKADALEIELNKAYEEKDVDKAIELIEEKKEVQEALKEVEKVEEVQIEKQAVIVAPLVVQEHKELPVVIEKASSEKPATNLIQMTPAEFESLINRILDGLDTNSSEQQFIPAPNNLNNENQNTNLQIEILNKRIDLLERLLLDVNARKTSEQQNVYPQKQNQDNNKKVSDISDKILEKLVELNTKVDGNTEKIDAQNNKAQTLIINPNSSSKEDVSVTMLDEEGEIIEQQDSIAQQKIVTYKHSSGFLGFNYGGASTANFGVRLHYQINKTPLQFMPEVFVGFGEATSYGASGNIIYPFSIKKDAIAMPYVGVGLGFTSIDSNAKGSYNVILGAQLPFIHKNVYVDYTMRNTFDYNQLAIGYKFPF